MSLVCLIIYHPAITRLTKSFLLRAIFHHESFEIEIIDTSTTAIFIQKVNKEKLWQATMDLLSADFIAIYSFANTKEIALQDALSLLETELNVKV